MMARGNRREAIFLDEDDRRFFLQAVSEACGRTGWWVHAWVLLGNHYHLLIETPEANLVAGMQWLQNTYTRRFNVRHRAWGRVFGDRYKAVVVEAESGHYYRTLLDYIHLNPVRAGLVRPRKQQSVLDFPWSSLTGGYALPPGKRAPWLAAARGLQAFGLEDTTAGRRKMVERLDRRAVEESAAECGLPELAATDVDARMSHLRRGWYWGTQAFAEKLLKRVQPLLPEKKARAYRSAAVQKAHDMQQAERWLQDGIAVLGLSMKEFQALKSTDPRKATLAQLLWQQTTVSQTWLAGRLGMCSAANVSQVLKRQATRKAPGRTGPHWPKGFGEWIKSVEL